MAGRRKVLLDGSTAVADGAWHNVGDYFQLAVQVFGMGAGDEVELYGSNDDGVSGPITHENIIGDPITEDDMITIDAAGMLWLRAKRTDATGGGTVSAVLNGL